MLYGKVGGGSLSVNVGTVEFLSKSCFIARQLS